jgi:hypothetical protein
VEHARPKLRSPLIILPQRSARRYGWIIAYPLQRRVWGGPYTYGGLNRGLTHKKALDDQPADCIAGEVFIVFPALWGLIAFFLYKLTYDPGSWDSVHVTGILSNVWMFLAILVGSHNSILSFVLGIPFERFLHYVRSHQTDGTLCAAWMSEDSR